MPLRAANSTAISYRVVKSTVVSARCRCPQWQGRYARIARIFRKGGSKFADADNVGLTALGAEDWGDNEAGNPLPNPPRKGEGARSQLGPGLYLRHNRHLPPCGGGWEGGTGTVPDCLQTCRELLAKRERLLYRTGQIQLFSGPVAGRRPAPPQSTGSQIRS